MDKIKAVIIDDEISAINALIGMLEHFCSNEVEIVATASDIEHAVLYLNQHRPELVFLDIELSPMTNGIEFIKRLDTRDFGVIVVTAYPHYAINAVNIIQPWGYLVKPVAVDDLVLLVNSAVVKVKAQRKQRNPELVPPAPKQVAKETARLGIIIPDAKKGNVVVKISDIHYLKSENSTVTIVYHSDGKPQRVVTYRTLRELEQHLPDYFFRVHNSIVVNMALITRYEASGRNGTVFLSDGTDLEVSVARLSEFQERFAAFVAMGY